MPIQLIDVSQPTIDKSINLYSKLIKAELGMEGFKKIEIIRQTVTTYRYHDALRNNFTN